MEGTKQINLRPSVKQGCLWADFSLISRLLDSFS